MKFAGLIRRRVWAALLLAVIGAGLVGCATEESANDSPRPWNTPEGWQNGSLPGMMTQPR
jgi:hypothetical protein